MEVHGLPLEGDTVVTLPKYVVFKGDNDKYLAASSTESHAYLQFNTTDIGDERVRHEVVPGGEGTVMLKCSHWNKFWRRSPECIWADTVDYNSSNQDLLFKPIKIDDQKVALRCVGNKLFCKRLTAEGKTDCLIAGTSTLERTAILGVGEPTISRNVHSIKYHLDTAHIYDLQPEILFKATATYPSDQLTKLQVGGSGLEPDLKVEYAYMKKMSTSWKCAVSFATGVKTTIQTGIPHVVEGNVEIPAQGIVSREWGITEETQTTVTGTYAAPLKAGQTVEVTVKGAHAKCDVKFSYIQTDLLTTGETVEIPKDDGVFNGLNTTDIKFEVRHL